MKGYVQDDKNTIYMPRQDIPDKEKSLKIRHFLCFLLEFYQRFTNIFGESDLLLSRIHTMKNKTERIRYGFDDYRVIIS